MIDKEKVIKGLECCSQTATLERPFICKDCPYFSEGGPCNRIQFARDILALLKEQDRLLHKKQNDIDKNDDANLEQEGEPLSPRDDGYYGCPKCHNLINSGSNYCPLCGQNILGC